MKKHLVFFSFGIAWAALMPNASAQPATRALLFTSNRLPPPDGIFLAPAQSSAASPNGIIVSNVVLRAFTQTMPAPPPGTSATLDSGLQAEFDLSSNGVAFTHVSLPAMATMTFRGQPASRNQQIYDTEMLQLNLSGELPGGLMIRESAAQPSLGQTILQRSPGGYLISSFFDVFFEVSADAGKTWKPMDTAQHAELRVDPSDPSGIPPVPEPSPLFPPPDDQLVMPPSGIATFAGGVQVKALRQTLFSQATDASQIPVDSKGMILPYIEQVDFHLSVNGGNTFVPVRAFANVSVALQKLRASPAHFFDTELLQLDITGNFPGGVVKIRESPTLPSYGGTSIQSVGGGTFELRSFFDVFLELSLDGGQTWTPVVNGPVHLEVQGNSPRDRYASPNLPTQNGAYGILIGLLRTYQTGGSGVSINGARFTGFSSSSPPPAAGQTLNQSFNGQMKLNMSFDGGKTFVDAAVTASAVMQVRKSALNGNNTAYYDTEMLQLNLTGLPQGARIRESPTLASTGRLSITPETGGYRIDSFFDIFTELSMDGGQTWHAAVEGSIPVGLTPIPAEAPLRIICPSNLAVPATGSDGAIVSFLILSVNGDCPLLPLGTVTCTPASGSVFPIGTTTVTCEAHNGCGEHVSCTFQVTVLPRLRQIPDFVFAKGFWPPPGGMFISPAQFEPLSIGGIILSNLTLRNFLVNVAPPAPGTSRTLDAGLTVELDYSADGGATFTHSVSPAKILIGLLNAGAGEFPGQEIHIMEIHRLEFSVGNPASVLRIREAAGEPSFGQTGVQPLPAGSGFAIASFFDVFFEVSTDDGSTWLPAGESTHLELRMDGGTLPRVPEFSPLSPPPDDRFASPPEIAATFAGGVRLKNLHQKLFSQTFDASLLGVSPTPVMQQLDSVVSLQWSLDGGGTFSAGRASARMVIAIKKVREAAIHFFDTELLELNISGGDLPANIMVRESPTLTSRGEMTLEPLADGTFTTSSFFDVFFEVSADGGQTWQPATSGPLHFDLQGVSLRSRFASQNLPPTGQYRWPPGTLQSFHPGGANIVVRGGIQRNFSESYPPPPPGQGQFENYNSLMDLQISLDGGQTFSSYTAPALTSVRVARNANNNSGDARFFDTEMLQLDISGGNLPQGMMLRESPSRSSLGRTAILPDGASGFRLDSFFDIFTELSLDSGRTWNSAVEGPVSMTLVPAPTFAPYVITCPSNIIVFATSPSGAVVNYTFPPLVFFPDCPFCCFGATGAPPSGALFPIGTTTVTGYGHDGCGENPTCSFTVTVLQPFIYGGLVESRLGSAVLNPYRSGPGAPASLIVSNLGPGGTDGFHVSPGAAESLVLNFQPFATTAITDTLFTATGPYGLDPDHLLGIAECSGGTNPMVRTDFSFLGAPSLLAQVRDGNHHLISSASLANNQWLDVNSLFPPGCTNPTTTVYTYWQGPDYSWWRFCKYGCNCIGTNCYIERIVCLRAVLAPHLRPRAISGFDLRARGSNAPASLTIQTIDLGMFGNLHEAKGDANFETDARFLAVNNIGSSGEDGVNVNLNNVGKFDLTLAPTRLLAPGACLKLTAGGDVNGLPAVQFGSVSLTRAAGERGMKLNGNFAELGASQVRVEFYQDSAYRGGVTVAAGDLGAMVMSGNLTCCGTVAQPSAGLRMSFDTTFLFTDLGNQIFAGNEIRILAANPTARLRGVSQFGIQACNLGQLAILDEIVTPRIGNLALASGGGLLLTGQGSPGQTYRLEAAPSLEALTPWKTVNSAEADVDGTFELSDTPNASQQFYRIVTPRD